MLFYPYQQYLSLKYLEEVSKLFSGAIVFLIGFMLCVFLFL